MLYNSYTDKGQRTTLLQEIISVCGLEFNRTQMILKRQMSTTKNGRRFFKRIANTHDNGNARIILKGKPESLAPHDKQLRYILCLCQPRMTASNAAEWLEKLDELYITDPSKRLELDMRVIDALGDLANIVGYTKLLSDVFPLSGINCKEGQRFVTRLRELEEELNQLKSEIDLSGFASSFTIPLQPEVARAALKEFKEFIINKAGTEIGFLYYDLLSDCMESVKKEIKPQAKEDDAQKTDKVFKDKEISSQFGSPKDHEVRVQERRQREKTRPREEYGRN
ncbi:hypothetical protein RRF57_012746 [Xylaria bambusicola]|uniref:Uncharacterized protein n=1 Tax=Xylaria bambusicola TaxID=326684 RepID=A0AAN7V4I8_9PEZI